jgi:hypothetical protein
MKWIRLQRYYGQRQLIHITQRRQLVANVTGERLQWATTASAALPQVTCVTVSPYAGRTLEAAPRLLAGSLDGHVKIYELDTFKVLVAKQSCLMTPEY